MKVAASAVPGRLTFLDHLDGAKPQRCAIHLPMPLPAAAGGVRSESRTPAPTRTKLSGFNANLHCSIIGTCFSAAELRNALLKLRLIDAKATEHDVHKAGVTVAGSRGIGAKLLNKALDRKFDRHIARFAKARTEAEVADLWGEALQAGDIPGAYWATLTHPLTTDALVCRAFGEIHMLSHLVGAANRADIRLLRDLEAENAELRDKVARQQSALHATVTSRDARIRDLGKLLMAALDARSGRTATSAPSADDAAMQGSLVEHAHRLTRAEARASHVEGRNRELERRLSAASARSARAEAESAALRDECAALEREIEGRPASPPLGEPAAALDLAGAAILYVGGRAHQVAHLRRVVEGANGKFIHHGGSLDDNPLLLPGCISRADAVLFPVDCVSHQAMNELKRLCKRSTKPYLPLRTGSIAALLHGLEKTQATLAAGGVPSDRHEMAVGI